METRTCLEFEEHRVMAFSFAHRTGYENKLSTGILELLLSILKIWIRSPLVRRLSRENKFTDPVPALLQLVELSRNKMIYISSL